MRRLPILLLLVSCAFFVCAQDTLLMETISQEDTLKAVLIVDEMENAIVHQDTLIRRMMIDKSLGIQRGQIEKNGFRVQVYSSNQQQVAKNEALILQQELAGKIDEPVYALSDPPFWKVRVGNFLTREDAMKYREQLIEQFPELQSSTYIVPDKIIIIN